MASRGAEHVRGDDEPRAGDEPVVESAAQIDGRPLRIIHAMRQLLTLLDGLLPEREKRYGDDGRELRRLSVLSGDRRRIGLLRGWRLLVARRVRAFGQWGETRWRADARAPSRRPAPVA